MEQSNHIDLEHWRQHQKRTEWDDNKVIRGLLLEPELKASWDLQLLLAGIDPKYEQDPQWSPVIVKNVQQHLESRGRPASCLAEMAFKHSSYQSNAIVSMAEDNLEPSNQDIDMDGYPQTALDLNSTMQTSNYMLRTIPNNPRGKAYPFINEQYPVVNRENGASFAQVLSGIGHDRVLPNAAAYESIGGDHLQRTQYTQNSPLDPRHPSMEASRRRLDLEKQSSAPWSAWALSTRQNFAQNPSPLAGLDDFQGGFDPNYGEMLVDAVSDGSMNQRNVNQMFAPQEGANAQLPLVAETTSPILVNAPVRSRPPRTKVVTGSKRKLSASRRRESSRDHEINPVIVNTGRYRHHDDHLQNGRRN